MEKIIFKPAVLCFNDWTGYREKPVDVVGETPKRYRIALRLGETVMRLAGRNRFLRMGETALVPKTAIKFREERAT